MFVSKRASIGRSSLADRTATTLASAVHIPAEARLDFRPVPERHMRHRFAVARLLAASAFAAIHVAGAQAAASALPQLGHAPLRAVVAALSDFEKVRLGVGRGLFLPAGMPTTMLPPGMLGGPRTGDDGALRLPGSAGETHAVRRLGIPAITLADGPAWVRIDPVRNGVNGKPDTSRTFHATAFPVGTLLAFSWDTALVRRVGVAFV